MRECWCHITDIGKANSICSCIINYHQACKQVFYNRRNTLGSLQYNILLSTVYACFFPLAEILITKHLARALHSTSFCIHVHVRCKIFHWLSGFTRNQLSGTCMLLTAIGTPTTAQFLAHQSTWLLLRCSNTCSQILFVSCCNLIIINYFSIFHGLILLF